jgi:hypothetical protein
MSIRQPGVYRKSWQLHDERDDKPKHDPTAGASRKSRANQRVVIEGPCTGGLLVDKAKANNGRQHQQTAELCEQEKFH